MTSPVNKTITLSAPVKVDGKEVSEVSLRCPKTGELRGLMLSSVLQMETSAMLRLLPRITMPPLTESQIADMPPSDFLEMTKAAVLFFMNPSQLAEVQAST